MILRAATLAFGFLIAAPFQACLAADLQIMAEDASEPFSRADGTGYANDILRAAFHAAGVEVAFDVVPYARCKKSLEQAKTPACFSMSWQKEFEGLIAFSEAPIFEVYADVFQSKGAPFKFAGAQDLGKGTILGIVNEYEYPESIYRLESRGVALERGLNEQANLKMLARGRLNAAVVMTSDFERPLQRARDAGVDAAVTYAFRSGTMKSYVGFSLKHPQGEWARQKFNAGYRIISANGTKDRIRNQWMSKKPQE
jgi:polar amino acid transport system substrate-binding protein